MLPLAERLSEHRPAIVYDQLGCGRSETPDDTSLWTVERFVTEVDQVRAALGLDRCHLLGQSWGGWLAIDYMARGPAGVVGLVLASTSASIAEFVAGARSLIDDMPEPHRTALTELGARGEYDHPDYRAGEQEFYRRHLCRLDPWPDALVRKLDPEEGNQVYATMNGPTEFDVIGHPAHMGSSPRSGPDRRADACHVRALRRDHAGLLRDDRRRHPRREDGRVRGERPRCPPGGTRGVRGDGGGVPGSTEARTAV